MKQPTKSLLLACGAIALLLAAPADAQTPTVGYLRGADDCVPVIDIKADGGELFSLKVNGSAGHADWAIHMGAKGGANVGIQDGDVGGPHVGAENAYQVIASNFREPEQPSDVVTVYVTFPNGAVAIDSGDLSTGFNFVTGVVQQVVGNSQPFVVPNAGIRIPGDRAAYTADLGSGPELFPRAVVGGWEVAWAPLLEIHDVAGVLPGDDPSEGRCTVAGGAGDLDASREQQSWGTLAGYNVYRLPADGARPSRAEIGALENFVYFAPVRADVIVPDQLSELIDPDGTPQTGDEILLFRDVALNPDGSARQIGLAPEPGRNYWHVIQPVTMGDIGGWSDLEFTFSWEGPEPVTERWVPLRDDWRTDLDGDGSFDSVALPRYDPPDEGSGPTFYSPQAEWGLPGLGLTNGGLPLLSPVVHTAGDNGDEDCTNGSDDDGDGLADCADGDCSGHPDCPDSGGGIRLGIPGGSPEVIVGWDETMGLSGVTLSRGELAVLWQETRLAHSLVGCDLTGREVAVPTEPGSRFFLAAGSDDSTPDFGSDSLGNRRSAPTGPCP